jgi:hypothetical protein
MALQITQDVDARYSAYNSAGRDVHNHCHTAAYESVSASQQLTPALSFYAPNILSSHFTGRGKELDHIGNGLDIVYGSAPTLLE